MHEHGTAPDHGKRQNIAMWVFLAIVLYFLVTEHWAHVVAYLPYALLLACPFMHLFMHGGHGGHGDGGSRDDGSGEHNGHQGHCGHDRRDEHSQRNKGRN